MIILYALNCLNTFRNTAFFSNSFAKRARNAIFLIYRSPNKFLFFSCLCFVITRAKTC